MPNISYASSYLFSLNKHIPMFVHKIAGIRSSITSDSSTKLNTSNALEYNSIALEYLADLKWSFPSFLRKSINPILKLFYMLTMSSELDLISLEIGLHWVDLSSINFTSFESSRTSLTCCPLFESKDFRCSVSSSLTKKGCKILPCYRSLDKL